MNDTNSERKQLSDVAKALNWQAPYQASLAERAAAIVAERDALKVELDVERERCSGIVQLARQGDIDQDWRSVIHRIEQGDSLAEIQAEVDRGR